MFDVSNKTCCVYDFGLFVDLAVKLGESFEKVYYFTEWQDDFTDWNEYKMGMNLPNVERAHNFFDIVDMCDLIVFPDIGKGDLQEYLRRNGKIVYGSGCAEIIEIERSMFNEMKKNLGMYEIPHKDFTSFKELRKYLEDKKDLFLKIDTFRGAMETERFINMKLSESFLDSLEHKIGFIKETDITITVEEPIKDAIEVGTDLICVDGKYSDKCLYGIEIKGEAYLGMFSEYKKLPKPLRDVNDKMESTLKGYGYRGGLSTEVRIVSKEIGYFIDICCRSGNPPMACELEAISNYAEAVYGAAMGVIVQLESKYKYVCQLQVSSSWAEKEPLAIEFPEKFRPFVKIKHWTVKKSKYGNVDYFVPNSKGFSSVAATVGVGKTMDEAIKMCKEVVDSLKGKGLEYRKEALDDAKEEVEKMYKMFPLSRI
jgi:hypothetical protein